jgi:alkylhydroperoxidase family enzyme
LLLVLRGAPAAVDVERDSVRCGIRGSPAQGSEEIRVELGYTRDVVIEHRRAFGDDTVSRAERTTVIADGRAAGDDAVSLARRTMVLPAKDLAG